MGRSARLRRAAASVWHHQVCRGRRPSLAARLTCGLEDGGMGDAGMLQAAGRGRDAEAEAVLELGRPLASQAAPCAVLRRLCAAPRSETA
jgi:hypothetical protein